MGRLQQWSEWIWPKTTGQENLPDRNKHRLWNTQSYVLMSRQCHLPGKEIHSKIHSKILLERMRIHQNVFLQCIFLQDMIWHRPLNSRLCKEMTELEKSILYLQQSYKWNTRIYFFRYEVSEFSLWGIKEKTDKRKCWCSSFIPRIHFKARHTSTSQYKSNLEQVSAVSASYNTSQQPKAAQVLYLNRK